MKQRLSFKQRAGYTKNKAAYQLFELMAAKETNLCLSADVLCQADLRQLIHSVGAEICVLKTHIDMLDDFEPNFIDELRDLSAQYRFMIFEDRKFADIGDTVKRQYVGGIYQIAEWARITNAHIITGGGIVDCLAAEGLARGNGLLLIAQMSSAGALSSPDYVAANIALARQYPEFVMGFIAQEQLCEDPGFIHMTPGVKFSAEKLASGQCYVTPHSAITARGSDIIIVGRGIYAEADPVAAAQQYRQAAWSAYVSCL